MNTTDGTWRCYSCREGGSIGWFLKKIGMSRHVAEETISALRLEPSMPRIRQVALLRKGWSTLPEYILGTYDFCPTSLVAAGYAPDFLQEHDVGYDKQEDRITFAVRDHTGRLVAISGRATQSWQFPRYKVYESSHFADVVKDYIPEVRRHLYCFHRVYAHRYFHDPEQDEPLPPLVIVEGYKGCLWLRQLGFEHTVALMGDVASYYQLGLLGRVKGPYIILLDHEPEKSLPDKNGYSKASTLAKKLSISGPALIGQYSEEKPEGTSPDDLTKNEIQHIIETALTRGQYAVKYSKLRRQRTHQ